MKQKYLILAVVLFLFNCGLLAQEHYATCKVVERNNKVYFEFSKEIKYLGTDYEKTIIYFGNKKLSFTDGQEAVSYLSSSWGWELCGNPIQLKDDTIMWTMKHKVERGIVNFRRNIEAIEEGRRRYSANSDDAYYR